MKILRLGFICQSIHKERWGASFAYLHPLFFLAWMTHCTLTLEKDELFDPFRHYAPSNPPAAPALVTPPSPHLNKRTSIYYAQVAQFLRASSGTDLMKKPMASYWWQEARTKQRTKATAVPDLAFPHEHMFVDRIPYSCCLDSGRCALCTLSCVID